MGLRVSRELLAGLLLVTALFVAGFLGGMLPGVQTLELQLDDMRMRAFPDKFAPQVPQIVIVDLDDASNECLQAVWPWPRSYFARMIRTLERAGARLVVIDVEFDKLREADPGGDDTLAAVLREYHNVVLAGKVTADGLLLPAAPFLNADSSNWASADIDEEQDQVVRQYFTCVRGGDGRWYPTLAVRACSLLTGRSPAAETQGRPFDIAYFAGRKSFAHGGQWHSFPVHSFYQVIDDSTFFTKDEREWGEEINWADTLIKENVFRGKVVLAGSSMAELHDTKLTPFSVIERRQNRIDKIPGVEIHAAALHTLLGNIRITQPPWELVIAALVLACLALFITGIRRAAWQQPLLLAVFCCGWTGGTVVLYNAANMQSPVVVPLVCMLLTVAGQQGYLFYLEQRRRRRITSMFGRYLAMPVVEQLIKDPQKMRLGGERRELTVMFTDLEGFTTMSEQMPPEGVVEMLNEHFEIMTGIIKANNGIVDKFEGDAIMAEFGIPLELQDHAVRACRTAIEMHVRMDDLRKRWRAAGRPSPRLKVGIGTGTMVFGNMGSSELLDYTVMGDVVNLASRLEGATREYGIQTLTNEQTYLEARGAMLFREMDLLRVKGKQQPVRCFQLIAPRDAPGAGQIEEVAALFGEGLALYRGRQWTGAVEAFGKVLAIWADDEAAKQYIARCEVFLKTPPPNDWDGVYVRTVK